MGISGVFTLAMITNRVFLIDWPELDQFFTSPFLDWSYNVDLIESTGSYTHSSALLNKIPQDLIDSVLESEFDNIAIRGNRAISSYLHENYFEGKFNDQSSPSSGFDFSRLNASTHFGCLINALLQPHKEVQDYAASVVNFTLPETANMIATNIRTGDDAFNDRKATYDQANTILGGTLFRIDLHFF